MCIKQVEPRYKKIENNDKYDVDAKLEPKYIEDDLMAKCQIIKMEEKMGNKYVTCPRCRNRIRVK